MTAFNRDYDSRLKYARNREECRQRLNFWPILGMCLAAFPWCVVFGIVVWYRHR